MIEPDKVEFSSGGKTTSDKVVEEALKHLMTKTRDVDSNVTLAAIHMSFLAGYAAASIQVMENAPDWLNDNPAEGLAMMSSALRDDLFERNEDIAWLQDVIATEGFVGWAFILRGNSDEGNARVLTFYSRAQGIFTLWELDDVQEVHGAWIAEGSIDDHPAESELRAMVAFSELTHFARIRYEQFGVTVCGPDPTDN